MTYVLYAPQQAPRQLTARAAIKHLGEHLQAFLNANNIASWKPDDDYVLRSDKVADVLVTLGNARVLTVAQLKFQAKLLQRLFTTSGAKISLSNSQNMVARCLGYKDYRLAYFCRSVDHYVDNLWPTEMVVMGQLLTESDLMHWGSSSLSDELRSRVRFNFQRSRLIREIDRAHHLNPTYRSKEFLRREKQQLKRGATTPIVLR
jgi:hypothetical protein